MGKTVVTAALLRALLLAGINAQKVKPVQTGVAPEQANTATLADARVYAAAVEGMPQSAAMLPATALHCFSLPASPHLAAAREGAHSGAAQDEVTSFATAAPAPLICCCSRALAVCGCRSTSVRTCSTSWPGGLPVLLVGGNYLGGLNHILLSMDALRHNGLQLAGVVLVPSADPAAGCPGGCGRHAGRQCRHAARAAGATWPGCSVELPRVAQLDAEGWQTLAQELEPLVASANPSDAACDCGADVVRRDHQTIWHPYASAIQPPLLSTVARTRANRIVLADGRELVDGMSSWWAAVHGYNHPRLMEALHAQAGACPT